ncbi:hypothetical protein [uncultured Gelidibacter sp.]|uniref:hypothetical protein n=1 Tax=uncultured Gelidibacter sp. TaxID=259318 RepID=UPI0026095A70|nr:hypothetical protein [uncultured Gelidibacter sp.]
MGPQHDTTNDTRKPIPLESEAEIQETQNEEELNEAVPVSEPNIEKKSFGERWKTHRFWLFRGTYYVLFSVWAIVMAIGGAIAWLIAMLFI